MVAISTMAVVKELKNVSIMELNYGLADILKSYRVRYC